MYYMWFMVNSVVWNGDFISMIIIFQ